MCDESAKPCFIGPRIKPSPNLVDSNLTFASCVNASDSALKQARRIVNGTRRVNSVAALSENREECFLSCRLMGYPFEVVAPYTINDQGRHSRRQLAQVL